MIDENDKDLEVENSQWDVSDLGKFCGLCLYHVMKNDGLMLTKTFMAIFSFLLTEV